jgi:thiamine pyrophosphate-dependent acetolactate synthase large subunit-like protein
MTGSAMDLDALVAALADVRGDAVVVTGPGAAAGALYAAAPGSPSLYNMELAYATPVAFGIALVVAPRPVIAIEGDGSLLAGLGSLATIARYAPANLTVVVVDNGIYGTGDNRVRTQSAFGADLAAVGRALGWPGAGVHRVGDAAALADALTGTGPRLVVASVDAATYPRSGRRVTPRDDVVEAAILLRRHLAGRDP